jgi:hypothetical protein
VSTAAGGYQLRPPDAHRDLADSWPLLYQVRRTGPGHDRGAGIEQAHLICLEGRCHQSVMCLTPDMAAGLDGYALTAGEITAATLAHIRQCHDAFVPVT